jgi:hypothetical protein
MLVAAAHKGKDLDYSIAERAAAKQIAEEERERRKLYGGSTPTTSSTWDGTIKTAGAEFARRINAMSRRFAEGRLLGLDRRLDVATPSTLGATTNVPRVTPRLSRNKPVSSREDTAAIVGVFVGNATGAQLIPDSEFAPSHHDHVTSNWRRSIADNTRVEQERRAAWLRKLEERRARS